MKVIITQFIFIKNGRSDYSFCIAAWWSKSVPTAPDGNTFKTYNIGGLDVVLIFLDLGLELINGDLLVLDDQVDLKLLDTESNGDELGGTPDEAILLDTTNVGLQLLKVGLIICIQVSKKSLKQ